MRQRHLCKQKKGLQQSKKSQGVMQAGCKRDGSRVQRRNARHGPANELCFCPLLLRPQLASLTKFCVTATHSSRFRTMCHQLRCGGMGRQGRGHRSALTHVDQGPLTATGTQAARLQPPSPAAHFPSSPLSLPGFPPHRHKHDFSFLQDALGRGVTHRLLR